jgi:hypothetical protein
LVLKKISGLVTTFVPNLTQLTTLGTKHIYQTSYDDRNDHTINRSSFSHMEKLSRSSGPPFVIEARIEPGTLQPIVFSFTICSTLYHAHHENVHPK